MRFIWRRAAPARYNHNTAAEMSQNYKISFSSGFCGRLKNVSAGWAGLAGCCAVGDSCRYWIFEWICKIAIVSLLCNSAPFSGDQCMVSTTVAWPQLVTATFLQAGKWKSFHPLTSPSVHCAAHCGAWSQSSIFLNKTSLSHFVTVDKNSKMNWIWFIFTHIFNQSWNQKQIQTGYLPPINSYKEQIGLKLIIYWREERCHLLFYNLLPRARHRSGRWAGKGGCVNGFCHYQYFGRGWGVQGAIWASWHPATRTLSLALFILFAITY